MSKAIRIGTRDSQLALWQAHEVKRLLEANDIPTELVYIKSEGDINLSTPLYELGVQGIFTKALDIALLNNNIDIAVHSMKDVPTQLAVGLAKAAVLKRASHKDIFVPREGFHLIDDAHSRAVVATSSIRRKAQWLHRFPLHSIESLRGNVNTRLRKVATEAWQGAIFAAAGLERISLRPAAAVDLDWMLPAPAQGAVMVVCRTGDDYCLEACAAFNDAATDLCTGIERDFLRALQGGCATPISGLAVIEDERVSFSGNILSVDGRQKAGISMEAPLAQASELGNEAATAIMAEGGDVLMQKIRDAA
jgi:hydroxymethylbilane synthase